MLKWSDCKRADTSKKMDSNFLLENQLVGNLREGKEGSDCRSLVDSLNHLAAYTVCRIPLLRRFLQIATLKKIYFKTSPTVPANHKSKEINN